MVNGIVNYDKWNVNGLDFQRKYSRWVTAHRSCGVQTRKCPETSKWASSHSSLRMVETPMVWTTTANIWNYWLWSLTIPAFTALWALDLGLKKWWGTRNPTVFPHFSLKAYNGGVCWQQDGALNSGLSPEFGRSEHRWWPEYESP